MREGLRSISTRSEEDEERLRKRLEAEEERERRAKAERLWEDTAFPPRHAAKADSLLVEAGEAHPEWRAKLNQVLASVAKGGIVGLIGTWGVGKTQLAACVGRRLCLEGSSARYFKAHRLFVELRSAFNGGDQDERRILDRMTAYRLFVIDDAHQRGHTDYEDRMLHHILDCRYDRERATILISNEAPGLFCESIGSGVVNRMKEGGSLLEFSWPSFRNQDGGGSTQ